jgi:hypothetical protein
LRVGRTLEHVIYALARDWGVNINRTTLEVLSSLDTSFNQLSRVVVAYASTDGEEKIKRRKAVREQAENISAKLIGLVADLDCKMTPEATAIPINVESIVRDIKKQFARRAKVLKTMNTIINENVVRNILDVRNDAAHASTNGQRREISKEEIDAVVDYLRRALLLFGNVAFAVAEKD